MNDTVNHVGKVLPKIRISTKHTSEYERNETKRNETKRNETTGDGRTVTNCRMTQQEDGAAAENDHSVFHRSQEPYYDHSYHSGLSPSSSTQKKDQTTVEVAFMTNLDTNSSVKDDPPATYGQQAASNYILLPDSPPPPRLPTHNNVHTQRSVDGRMSSSTSTMTSHSTTISTEQGGRNNQSGMNSTPNHDSKNKQLPSNSSVDGCTDCDNRQELLEQPDTTPTTTTRRQEFMAESWDLLMDLIQYGKAKTWKKKLMTVTLFLSSLYVFYDLLFGGNIVQCLHAFTLWMADHSIEAVFAFIGIFVISTLIFIPPNLLVFGAGYAFTIALDSTWVGVLAALFCCFQGSCIGAIIAFLRSRYMMRDLMYLFCRRYPLVRVADRALKYNGFRIMLLLRLCPLIPFNGLNYCCGITGVSLHDFVSSLIGILPFHLYTIMLGATVGLLDDNFKNDHLTQRQRTGYIVFLVSGILFGLVAMALTWRVVRRELQRELELSDEEFDSLIHPSSDKSLSVSSSIATTDGTNHGTNGWVGSTIVVNTSSSDCLNRIELGGSGVTTSTTAAVDNRNHNQSVQPQPFPWTDKGEEWYWIWA